MYDSCRLGKENDDLLIYNEACNIFIVPIESFYFYFFTFMIFLRFVVFIFTSFTSVTQTKGK